MKGKRGLQLTGNFLLLVFFISLTTVQLSVGQAIDEFDSPVLNEALWNMKSIGDASFDISNGVLTMSSPAVESGIMLYYPENVEDVDITFEVNLDTSGVVDNITVGFIADLMKPQINTDINNHWEANFFFVPANRFSLRQHLLHPPKHEQIRDKRGRDEEIERTSKGNGGVAYD